MIELKNLQLLLFGLAAVLDVALLAALFERRNLRRTSPPIIAFLSGVALLHGGTFLQVLLSVGGAWSQWPRWMAMLAMATGILMIPAALMHGFVRGQRMGQQRPWPRWWEPLSYLPCLVLFAAAVQLARNPMGSFMQQVWPFAIPYCVWLGVTSGLAGLTLGRLFRSSGLAPLRRLVLIGVGIQFVGLASFPLLTKLRPGQEGLWAIPAALSPLAVVLPLAWAILRYGKLRVALRRAVIYAALVPTFLIIDRTVLAPYREAWSRHLGVDLGLVFGIAVVGLAFLWTPVRERLNESARHLFGERASVLRQRCRSIAVELTRRAGEDSEGLAPWFARALGEAVNADEVLIQAEGVLVSSLGETPGLDSDRLAELRFELEARGRSHLTPDDALHTASEEWLLAHDIGLLVRLEQHELRGWVILIQTRLRREWDDERVTAALLLVEQFGAALSANHAQARRVEAERHAWQAQKMSQVGLMASSIAHEVKNPLSSIKTIVSVLEEEVGTEHQQDLGVVRGEIDRLNDAVRRLLGFARPSNDEDPLAARGAIESTISIVGHLARRAGVSFRQSLADDLPRTRGGDALREILFNLLSNAIEASGAGSEVALDVSADEHSLIMVVTDEGPGLPESVRDRMFEPFVTTRDEGFGLGLYIVGQRLNELGGQLSAQVPESGKGTRMRVTLPLRRGEECR